MPLDEKRTPLTQPEKKLIDNIKNARLDAGITQEELSYKLNKNSNYMGMVESYRRRISLKSLFRIASVLNVKAKDFFNNI